jgi:transposase-like protein
MSDRREYDYATRTLAEQLYVFQGCTYEEISAQLGVSEGQLKRWGKAAEWRGKREQYLTSKSQTLTRMIGIRDRILETLEGELQPNTVHQLLAGLRQADSMIEQQISPTGPEVDRPAIFLEDLRLIVQILKEVEPMAVGLLADNFDLIVDKFKDRYGK